MMTTTTGQQTNDGAPVGRRAPRARRAGLAGAALAAVAVLGLASSVALSRRLDARRADDVLLAPAEELYVKPETARRLSLGFSGLAADWYWMRSLQYVGRKVIDSREPLQLDDLSPLGLKLLHPLLDTATTLDPQFMSAYEYGAVVLPAVDRESAVRLIHKGIAANPHEWRFYHHLGYIRWQEGRLREASKFYLEGSRVPGAPDWMETMAARLEAEGGDRELAREMFRRMHDEAQDERVRELARKRLMQVASFDERDLIRRVLEAYRARAGRCPESLSALAPVLRRVPQMHLDASGTPLDPAGTPYLLATKDGGCDVDLDPRSEVPYK